MTAAIVRREVIISLCIADEFVNETDEGIQLQTDERPKNYFKDE